MVSYPGSGVAAGGKQVTTVGVKGGPTVTYGPSTSATTTTTSPVRTGGGGGGGGGSGDTKYYINPVTGIKTYRVGGEVPAGYVEVPKEQYTSYQAPPVTGVSERYFVGPTGTKTYRVGTDVVPAGYKEITKSQYQSYTPTVIPIKTAATESPSAFVDRTISQVGQVEKPTTRLTETPSITERGMQSITGGTAYEIPAPVSADAVNMARRIAEYNLLASTQKSTNILGMDEKETKRLESEREKLGIIIKTKFPDVDIDKVLISPSKGIMEPYLPLSIKSDVNAIAQKLVGGTVSSSPIGGVTRQQAMTLDTNIQRLTDASKSLKDVGTQLALQGEKLSAEKSTIDTTNVAAVENFNRKIEDFNAAREKYIEQKSTLDKEISETNKILEQRNLESQKITQKQEELFGKYYKTTTKFIGPEGTTGVPTKSTELDVLAGTGWSKVPGAAGVMSLPILSQLTPYSKDVSSVKGETKQFYEKWYPLDTEKIVSGTDITKLKADLSYPIADVAQILKTGVSSENIDAATNLVNLGRLKMKMEEQTTPKVMYGVSIPASENVLINELGGKVDQYRNAQLGKIAVETGKIAALTALGGEAAVALKGIQGLGLLGSVARGAGTVLTSKPAMYAFGAGLGLTEVGKGAEAYSEFAAGRPIAGSDVIASIVGDVGGVFGGVGLYKATAGKPFEWGVGKGVKLYDRASFPFRTIYEDVSAKGLGPGLKQAGNELYWRYGPTTPEQYGPKWEPSGVPSAKIDQYTLSGNVKNFDILQDINYEQGAPSIFRYGGKSVPRAAPETTIKGELKPSTQMVIDEAGLKAKMALLAQKNPVFKSTSTYIPKTYQPITFETSGTPYKLIPGKTGADQATLFGNIKNFDELQLLNEELGSPYVFRYGTKAISITSPTPVRGELTPSSQNVFDQQGLKARMAFEAKRNPIFPSTSTYVPQPTTKSILPSSAQTKLEFVTGRSGEPQLMYSTTTGKLASAFKEPAYTDINKIVSFPREDFSIKQGRIVYYDAETGKAIDLTKKYATRGVPEGVPRPTIEQYTLGGQPISQYTVDYLRNKAGLPTQLFKSTVPEETLTLSGQAPFEQKLPEFKGVSGGVQTRLITPKEEITGNVRNILKDIKVIYTPPVKEGTITPTKSIPKSTSSLTPSATTKGGQTLEQLQGTTKSYINLGAEQKIYQGTGLSDTVNELDVYRRSPAGQRLTSQVKSYDPFGLSEPRVGQDIRGRLISGQASAPQDEGSVISGTEEILSIKPISKTILSPVSLFGIGQQLKQQTGLTFEPVTRQKISTQSALDISSLTGLSLTSGTIPVPPPPVPTPWPTPSPTPSGGGGGGGGGLGGGDLIIIPGEPISPEPSTSPEVTPIETPWPGFAGFMLPGSLGEGKKKYKRQRGTVEWLVVNPIRNLPAEYWGKGSYTQVGEPKTDFASKINMMTGVGGKKTTMTGMGGGISSAKIQSFFRGKKK